MFWDVVHKTASNAPYLDLVNESVYVGEASKAASFLNVAKLVQIALDYKCDAVHPGYGFMSENADFAIACEKAGVVFIGPPVKCLRRTRRTVSR